MPPPLSTAEKTKFLVFLVAPDPARTSPLARVMAASRSSVAALRDKNEPREDVDNEDEDNSWKQGILKHSPAARGQKAYVHELINERTNRKAKINGFGLLSIVEFLPAMAS